MQIAGLVISLALIITAVVIVFTSLAPMMFHKTPPGMTRDPGSPPPVRTSRERRSP